MNEEQTEENQDSAPTSKVLEEDFPSWNPGPREQIQRQSGLESAWAT
jgi:hypothetical protein